METFKSVISFGREKLWSGFRYVYYDINPSTLTGAIDVIVIEDQNGSFNCGPFHVRFGKMGTLKPADKIVDIHLNGKYLENLHMKLGPAGEAYFVEGVQMEHHNIDRNLEVSPIQSDDEGEMNNNERLKNSELGARVLSADQINHDTSISKKKRVRRGLRMKSESNIKTGTEENSAVMDQTYLSDNDECVDNLESKLRGGYNSDGAVDQIDKEKPDINMSWEWGNFPETKSGNINKDGSCDNNEEIVEKEEINDDALDNSADITTEQQEVYLEELVGNDVSDEIKQQYLYTSIPNDVNRCSIDKQIRDNTTNDAGYKSDENTYQGSSTLPISPTYPAIHELKLSLCGDINTSGKITNEKFFEHLISYEDFMKEPDELLKNKDLVVLLNGKYYNWTVAAPIILSIIAFQTELPGHTISNMKNMYMSRKQQRRTWFGWRRQTPEETDTSPERSMSNTKLNTIGSENQDVGLNDSSILEPQSELEPDSSKNKENIGSRSVSVDKNVASELNDGQCTTSDDWSLQKIYLKKIRLSSDEVAALDLQEGRNDITFSMTTKYQGTTSCKAAIYRWKWHDKIVISDVDGTITKSDVLGHVLPILGRDWTQSGVAKLYNKICANNYKFIYLSARAIGQSQLTRTYLEDITQDSSEKLPEGPILLSPTSLFQSLHREVIEKKPEYFKIQCLNDVKNLFPNPDSNPLYAGFGNRPNDVIAYKAVGIDPKRIFTVNPEGSLKNEYCQKWSTNYGSLSEVTDYFFQYQFEPHYSSNNLHFELNLEDYSDVNYWTLPVDETVIRDELNRSKTDSVNQVNQSHEVATSTISLSNNNTSADIASSPTNAVDIIDDNSILVDSNSVAASGTVTIVNEQS